MKIGIFGGTFDPIHNAHLIIAQYAREQFEIDKMLIMPGGNPPHKKGITDKNIRYEMTILAAESDFEVSDYEIKKDDFSYTLNTLLHYKKLYPDDELFFVIGEDSLNDISSWYHPERILRLCTLLVFPRFDSCAAEKEIDRVKNALGGDIRLIDAPIFTVSSSEIRKRISEGKSVKHMLPENVRQYIEEKGLYNE